MSGDLQRRVLDRLARENGHHSNFKEFKEVNQTYFIERAVVLALEENKALTLKVVEEEFVEFLDGFDKSFDNLCVLRRRIRKRLGGVGK